jgi:hypothetical protein
MNIYQLKYTTNNKFECNEIFRDECLPLLYGAVVAVRII